MAGVMIFPRDICSRDFYSRLVRYTENKGPTRKIPLIFFILVRILAPSDTYLVLAARRSIN